MATIGIDICSPYGMACTECNDLLVAPKWSAYVSKREVRHFWSCENCGHEISTNWVPRLAITIGSSPLYCALRDTAGENIGGTPGNAASSN